MRLEIILLAALVRTVWKRLEIHRCDGCGRLHVLEFLHPTVGIVCETCIRREWFEPIRATPRAW